MKSSFFVCVLCGVMGLIYAGCGTRQDESKRPLMDMMHDDMSSSESVSDMMHESDISPPPDLSTVDMFVEDMEPVDMSPDASVNMSVCDPLLGTPPLPPCTVDAPCSTREGEVLDTPSIEPECMTTRRDRPFFDDGPAESLADADGYSRYACLFKPEGTSAEHPRPLIIWLHGGAGDVSNLYNSTSLREKAVDYDLSADPERPGFILLAIQSRVLHYPYSWLADGPHHNSLTWNFETNQDLHNLDAWIDLLARDGHVDTSRIYVMGWSEGEMLSALYGLTRYDTPTPGGHRVAAMASYSGSNPFNRALDDNERCVRQSVELSALPIYLVSRSCDGAACNEQHQQDFISRGNKVDSVPMSQWVDVLAQRQAGEVVHQLINDEGVPVERCASTCTYTRGALNHLTWPSGANGQDSVDNEPAMLEFLRNHPR